MTARRSALGRGLGALIPSREPTQHGDTSEKPRSQPSQASSTTSHEARPDASPAAPASDDARFELPVDRIDPNPEQPRRHFDPAQLEQLAASILRHGVLQPVVVRRAGDRFELIVGERRWRASRAAGLEKIPAVVADVAPQERLEVAIVENVQRHDLNPIELAHAYRALADSGATQDEIGRKVSMDRSSIANHLRLLDLSRELQEDVEQARLTMGHAKALLQVSDPERRRGLRDKIVKEGLSVRATERLGRQIEGPAPTRRPESPTERVDPDIARVVEDLQGRYQTRIQLKGSTKKGRLEVDYYSPEDLNRVLSLMLGELVSDDGARPPLVPAGGRFEGLITFRGEACVAGEVVGPIEGSGRLELRGSASVSGPVNVDDLDSAGAIDGDVEVRGVARFESGATLRGTLRAPRLAVANGAVIQGRCSVGDASE